jgi:hypothetical protein
VCAVWRAPAKGWDDDPLAGGWIVIIHHWLFWVLRIVNEGNRWERAIIITKLCVCVKWREKSAPQRWTKSYFSPNIRRRRIPFLYINYQSGCQKHQ